ncbi:MAG: hypothetical protein IT186_21785 [Acidobacteria bacterium]|nr:hypothetical protein [Acidobacteriota bacterium]MCG3191877.1 hypothetical protein [Thermoanaerobaculia bacterium]MCK6681776.1 hypothetical protein [Thermoanaerobaculia bacterium]
MNDMKVHDQRCETCARKSEELSCQSCPVCGSEECEMLSQLGNYCETRTAITLAARVLELEMAAAS